MRTRSVFVVALLLSGCATLPPPPPDIQPITRETVSALDGVYAWEGDNPDCDSTRGSWTCSGTFARVVEQNGPSLFHFRSWGVYDSTATVRLRLSPAGRLFVTATGSEGSVATANLGVGIRSNGTMMLKGRGPLVGAPPIAWGVGLFRSRLALDQNGDLLFSWSGGGMTFFTIMPIMPGGSRGTLRFRRLDDPGDSAPAPSEPAPD